MTSPLAPHRRAALTALRRRIAALVRSCGGRASSGWLRRTLAAEGYSRHEVARARVGLVRAQGSGAGIVWSLVPGALARIEKADQLREAERAEAHERRMAWQREYRKRRRAAGAGVELPRVTSEQPAAVAPASRPARSVPACRCGTRIGRRRAGEPSLCLRCERDAAAEGRAA